MFKDCENLLKFSILEEKVINKLSDNTNISEIGEDNLIEELYEEYDNDNININDNSLAKILDETESFSGYSDIIEKQQKSSNISTIKRVLNNFKGIKTENGYILKEMFWNCSSLISLSDISIWDINNVTDISGMFNNCSSLISLPDISNWTTNNVTNMSLIFANCSSLISLPDISKWNTNNVTDMSGLFGNCPSLISLPDISKWNISNVTNLSLIFYKCSSLKTLPDISKWKLIILLI